ncbi:MAG: hypothetical protein MUF71_12970 [Candidatus Kapabacteria bacterium]|jgi:hypothetical protein|nr:hypothetical protein [Candidatus Kapabacteria bacterium]
MNKPLEFRFVKSAEKFLAKNSARLTKDEVKKLVKKAVRFLYGNQENVDMKRLQGYSNEMYRILAKVIYGLFSLSLKEKLS